VLSQLAVGGPGRAFDMESSQVPPLDRLHAQANSVHAPREGAIRNCERAIALASGQLDGEYASAEPPWPHDQPHSGTARMARYTNPAPLEPAGIIGIRSLSWESDEPASGFRCTYARKADPRLDRVSRL